MRRNLPTVPWDFSVEPGPDATVKTRDMETEESRQLGESMARIADNAEREMLKQFPDHLPRCNDCALRNGTLPNGDLETLFDVIKCVVEDEPFYCHKGIQEGGPPKRMCSGFAYLTGTDIRDRFKAFAHLQEEKATKRRARNKRKADRRRSA